MRPRRTHLSNTTFPRFTEERVRKKSLKVDRKRKFTVEGEEKTREKTLIDFAFLDSNHTKSFIYSTHGHYQAGNFCATILYSHEMKMKFVKDPT